jgi:hypothetical protein
MFSEVTNKVVLLTGPLAINAWRSFCREAVR